MLPKKLKASDVKGLCLPANENWQGQSESPRTAPAGTSHVYNWTMVSSKLQREGGEGRWERSTKEFVCKHA